MSTAAGLPSLRVHSHECTVHGCVVIVVLGSCDAFTVQARREFGLMGLYNARLRSRGRRHDLFPQVEYRIAVTVWLLILKATRLGRNTSSPQVQSINAAKQVGRATPSTGNCCAAERLTG